jgi:DNA-binding MarR family transcriptional regulator
VTGDLSAKAYGILMAIIQHNLNISVDNLRTHFKEGERAISSGLKELRENNYIETKKHRIGNRIVTMSSLTEKSERLFFGVNSQSVDLQNVGSGISNEHISRITNSTVISKNLSLTKSRDEYEVMNIEVSEMAWGGIFESASGPDDEIASEIQKARDKRKAENKAVSEDRKKKYKEAKTVLDYGRKQGRAGTPRNEWSVRDVCYEFASRISDQFHIAPWEVTQSQFSGALAGARTRLSTDGEIEVRAMEIFFSQINIKEYKDAEILWKLYVSRLPGLVGQAKMTMPTDKAKETAKKARDKARRELRGE